MGGSVARDQKLCRAVAGKAGSPLKQSHYETHADPLAQWVSAVSLWTLGCVSFVPPLVVAWDWGQSTLILNGLGG